MLASPISSLALLCSNRPITPASGLLDFSTPWLPPKSYIDRRLLSVSLGLMQRCGDGQKNEYRTMQTDLISCHAFKCCSPRTPHTRKRRFQYGNKEAHQLITRLLRSAIAVLSPISVLNPHPLVGGDES